MSLWRQATRGLRVLTNRAAADRDVADEVEHYLEQAASALEADGLSPEAARRAARVQLGNATVLNEQVRAYGWENVVGTVLADLRYAARRLRASPGFTIAAVLTLAVGIGASTAIFSAVNPILFESLPYPHAERVVMLWDHSPDGSRFPVTFGTYRELATRSHSFEALAVMKTWQPTLTDRTEPERFDGQRVSAEYFRALGVRPALGREFDASDDRVRGPRVVIIADGLWRRRFGADPTLVGRQVTLDDSLYTVIGIMPAGFENVPASAAEVWSTMQYDASLPSQGREWGHHLRMVGRFKPGVTIGQAVGDLDAIARAPVAEFRRVPWALLRQGPIVVALQEDVTRGIKPALVAVLGAVVLVLVIACVNVSNLLIARGTQRRAELAVRAALGAGRSRMIRQLLTESLLLAALGGVLALAVAHVGVLGLVALSPPGLPRLAAIRLDAAVFVFALVLSTLTGLAVGVIPAVQASRGDLQRGLHEASRRAADGHHAARRMLVVAEVALALVLLVSAGLLFRSLQRLFAVAPGFDASQLLTMQVQINGHRFDDPNARRRFFADALDAVRRVPGVTRAALTSQLPLAAPESDVYGVQLESRQELRPEEDTGALRYTISPGYFEAMGIPLRRGRVLDARDAAGSPVAVVVNESFATRRFGARDPIGQRLHFGSRDIPWYTIVGVVGDVKQASLAVDQSDAVYVTIEQWYSADPVLSLVVRARTDAAALVPAVKRAVWSVDKDQPIARIATMTDLVSASAAERRFALILFEAFALAALVLAATGIYGVLSGRVVERTREIGIRSALGASRREILELIMRQGMTLTGVGIVIGLIGAVIASDLIVTLLFGVTRLDPPTYLSVVALILGVSAVACGVPAWRAALVDPSVTLRAE